MPHYTSLCLDTTGSVYVAGTCKDSIGDNEYVVLKYNAEGTLLWTAKNNINISQADYIVDIALDNAGNVFATGNAGTVKYNNNGTFQWLQTGDFSTMQVDGLGNVYVGHSKPANLTKYDNSTGYVLWSTDSIQVYDLEADYNNDLYVVSNYKFRKISSSGSLIASIPVSYATISGSVSNNLNLYVVGTAAHTPGYQGASDIIVEKYSQCPAVASLKSLSPQSPENNFPQHIQPAPQFSIVPNPNNGEMLLQSTDNFEQGIVFMIIDFSGRILYEKTITELTNSLQIATSDLKNGIYLYAVSVSYTHLTLPTN
jgi:hypothetical protein